MNGKIEQNPGNAVHAGVKTNRLAGSASPYLLQHAHNPVDWYPWGDEALQRARREDKPIFLSIGYSACHWCHVMAHESFENDEIAAILNEHFISIKVDREERPDLDDIYMNAVQMITGRGGWPLSVFLTPDLKPFYGGTYFPPDDRHGMPGFKRVLNSISDVWRDRRAEAEKGAEDLSDAIRTAAERTAKLDGGKLTPFLIDAAAAGIMQSFDPEWGGFGGAPKFPPSGDVRLLLRRYAETGDEETLRIVNTTLERMAYGGMYDQVGGGFHRYSVDKQWLVPHFEKMLYDNALLAVVYLEAYQVTGRPLYSRIARETLDYVLRDMTSDEGGFYSSQDADSEGEEGIYYIWTPDQIEKALGRDGAEYVSSFYGVTKAGNFEGRNILNIGRDANPEENNRKQIDAYRRILLDVRQRRIPPHKDDKILTDWNSLMITAFARGWEVLDDERYRTAAARAGDFIRAKMMKSGELYHAYRGKLSDAAGYLDDYAGTSLAFIDLYEITGDESWLEASDTLIQKMIELFDDGDGVGAFYFTSDRHKDLLARLVPLTDTSSPSGNTLAAESFLRMGRLTGNSDYVALAERLLGAAVPILERSPRAATHMLRVVHMQMGPPVEIAVIGDAADEDFKKLLATANSGFLPRRILAHGKAGGRVPMPLLEGRGKVDGRAAGYVCENYACRMPVTAPADLATQLSSMYSIASQDKKLKRR